MQFYSYVENVCLATKVFISNASLQYSVKTLRTGSNETPSVHAKLHED